MSRIGRQLIPVPEKTTATLQDGTLMVKGQKGELTLKLHPHVSVEEKEKSLHVSVKNPDDRSDRALWGLYRSLIANMVTGVTDGFEKTLQIQGVGFKAALSGKKLTLNLGFSHPVEVELPEGISASVEKDTIRIQGIDKQLVGDFAAKIRSLKKPEPYKGKGLRYTDEVVRRKAGKVVKSTEGS